MEKNIFKSKFGRDINRNIIHGRETRQWLSPQTVQRSKMTDFLSLTKMPHEKLWKRATMLRMLKLFNPMMAVVTKNEQTEYILNICSDNICIYIYIDPRFPMLQTSVFWYNVECRCINETKVLGYTSLNDNHAESRRVLLYISRIIHKPY